MTKNGVKPVNIKYGKSPYPFGFALRGRTKPILHEAFFATVTRKLSFLRQLSYTTIVDFFTFPSVRRRAAAWFVLHAIGSKPVTVQDFVQLLRQDWWNMARRGTLRQWSVSRVGVYAVRCPLLGPYQCQCPVSECTPCAAHSSVLTSVHLNVPVVIVDRRKCYRSVSRVGVYAARCPLLGPYQCQCPVSGCTPCAAHSSVLTSVHLNVPVVIVDRRKCYRSVSRVGVYAMRCPLLGPYQCQCPVSECTPRAAHSSVLTSVHLNVPVVIVDRRKCYRSVSRVGVYVVRCPLLGPYQCQCPVSECTPCAAHSSVLTSVHLNVPVVIVDRRKFYRSVSRVGVYTMRCPLLGPYQCQCPVSECRPRAAHYSVLTSVHLNVPVVIVDRRKCYRSVSRVGVYVVRCPLLGPYQSVSRVGVYVVRCPLLGPYQSVSRVGVYAVRCPLLGQCPVSECRPCAAHSSVLTSVHLNVPVVIVDRRKCYRSVSRVGVYAMRCPLLGPYQCQCPVSECTPCAAHSSVLTSVHLNVPVVIVDRRKCYSVDASMPEVGKGVTIKSTPYDWQVTWRQYRNKSQIVSTFPRGCTEGTCNEHTEVAARKTSTDVLHTDGSLLGGAEEMEHAISTLPCRQRVYAVLISSLMAVVRSAELRRLAQNVSTTLTPRQPRVELIHPHYSVGRHQRSSALFGGRGKIWATPNIEVLRADEIEEIPEKIVPTNGIVFANAKIPPPGIGPGSLGGRRVVWPLHHRGPIIRIIECCVPKHFNTEPLSLLDNVDFYSSYLSGRESQTTPLIHSHYLARLHGSGSPNAASSIQRDMRKEVVPIPPYKRISARTSAFKRVLDAGYRRRSKRCRGAVPLHFVDGRCRLTHVNYLAVVWSWLCPKLPDVGTNDYTMFKVTKLPCSTHPAITHQHRALCPPGSGGRTGQVEVERERLCEIRRDFLCVVWEVTGRWVAARATMYTWGKVVMHGLRHATAGGEYGLHTEEISYEQVHSVEIKTLFQTCAVSGKGDLKSSIPSPPPRPTLHNAIFHSKPALTLNCAQTRRVAHLYVQGDVVRVVREVTWSESDVVRVVTWSERERGQSGDVVRERHGQRATCGDVVRVMTWSEWCRGQSDVVKSDIIRERGDVVRVVTWSEVTWSESDMVREVNSYRQTARTGSSTQEVSLSSWERVGRNVFGMTSTSQGPTHSLFCSPYGTHSQLSSDDDNYLIQLSLFYGAASITTLGKILITSTSYIFDKHSKAQVAERLDCSPPTKANRVQSPAVSLPDFGKWEYCQTMPLVGGFSRGSLVYPALAFHRCSILNSHLYSMNIDSPFSSYKRLSGSETIACFAPTPAALVTKMASLPSNFHPSFGLELGAEFASMNGQAAGRTVLAGLRLHSCRDLEQFSTLYLTWRNSHNVQNFIRSKADIRTTQLCFPSRHISASPPNTSLLPLPTHLCCPAEAHSDTGLAALRSSAGRLSLRGEVPENKRKREAEHPIKKQLKSSVFRLFQQTMKRVELNLNSITKEKLNKTAENSGEKLKSGKREISEKTLGPAALTDMVPTWEIPDSVLAGNSTQFALVGDERSSRWTTTAPMYTLEGKAPQSGGLCEEFWLSVPSGANRRGDERRCTNVAERMYPAPCKTADAAFLLRGWLSTGSENERQAVPFNFTGGEGGGGGSGRHCHVYRMPRHPYVQGCQLACRNFVVLRVLIGSSRGDPIILLVESVQHSSMQQAQRIFLHLRLPEAESSADVGYKLRSALAALTGSEGRIRSSLWMYRVNSAAKHNRKPVDSCRQLSLQTGCQVTCLHFCGRGIPRALTCPRCLPEVLRKLFLLTEETLSNAEETGDNILQLVCTILARGVTSSTDTNPRPLGNPLQPLRRETHQLICTILARGVTSSTDTNPRPSGNPLQPLRRETHQLICTILARGVTSSTDTNPRPSGNPLPPVSLHPSVNSYQPPGYSVLSPSFAERPISSVFNDSDIEEVTVAEFSPFMSEDTLHHPITS
ncbi:hypothetical protein PR048_003906 [Dryococelus australis]|uniref:Uncharacterized protein n=1 Tax=Dryococelus australis TaxID=614101 RepID=A0ABQ9IPB0_9NEOP|nr:hypothetical protein PR048_003906 [Dryococelus australis]